MSDLEWMQLKHYYRWRKRLQDDPYKAIFGASNDMLNGKGLIDWEWINKSFPKWMLNNTDVNEQSQGKRDSTPAAREPIFPQPSFRKISLDRDGIKSPSDSRRPQEGVHANVVGNAPGRAPSETPVTTRSTTATAPESIDPLSTVVQPDSRREIARMDSYEAVQKEENNLTSNDEGGSVRGIKAMADAAKPSSPAAFRDHKLDELSLEESQNELDVLATQIRQREKDRGDESWDPMSWRQTALQRREMSASTQKPLPNQSGRPSHVSTIQSTIALEDLGPLRQATTYNDDTTANAPEQDASSASVRPSTRENVSATPSISKKLSQLPEDDIDFLSAADIRASMGSKRGWRPTNEQKQASRQRLEQAFNGNEETSSIHPMLEARIVNNQYIRRTERKMRDEQLGNEDKEEPSEGAAVTQPPLDTPVESSIERMKRWLETTGASFAKTFWQDPTEEADVTKTKLFFDKVAHYVKKGQSANRQITEDLEKDIPASQALLRRLKSDEERLDLAIHRLRQRTSSGHAQDLSPRKIRAMESLKVRFHQTNHELETAYEALRGLVGTESVSNATGSFKRRLTTASKVLHKNSQLLRMLIWSLQTRLEDPKIDRNILLNYKVVADNLLSLRDTQMTLMRLVDRAMLVYGVVPAGSANDNAAKIELADFENCEDPFVRARLAADVHLINEIKAHKSRPREITNEDTFPAQRPSNKKVLDEPSPLMNSLFRPFGPAIEKLGNKELRELAAEKAVEEEKRQLNDSKLIDEIKAAYEDTYGPITADHRQDTPLIPDVQKVQGASTEFLMLKDDPVLDLDPKESNADASYQTENSPQDATATIESAAALGHPVEALAESAALTTDNATAVETSRDGKDGTRSRQAQSETAASTASGSPDTRAQDVQGVKDQKQTTPGPAIEHLPTRYTIVIRDPEADTLSITTSMTEPPRDMSPAVPLHLALSALDSPAKFIPYITEGLEVVSAKKDILVLRDIVESPCSAPTFSTISSSSTAGGSESIFDHGATNPIDGTTRLSPTGYVGPEESAEQLEKEFQDRRNAADKLNWVKETKQNQAQINAKHRKSKRKGGAGSVVKTAIWVAGMCYIAGVIGEISTGGL